MSIAKNGSGITINMSGGGQIGAVNQGDNAQIHHCPGGLRGWCISGGRASPAR